MKRTDDKPEPILPSAMNPMGEAVANRAMLIEARTAHIETVEWLERLTTNEDFERFITFVEKGAAIAKVKSREIDTRDTQARDAYNQRFAGLESMVNWPQEQLEASRNAIKSLDDKLRGAV